MEIIDHNAIVSKSPPKSRTDSHLKIRRRSVSEIDIFLKPTIESTDQILVDDDMKYNNDCCSSFSF